jgi:hypothetical protein
MTPNYEQFTAFCSLLSAVSSLPLPAPDRYSTRRKGDGALGNECYGVWGKVTGKRYGVEQTMCGSSPAFTSGSSDRLRTTPGQVLPVVGGSWLRRGAGYRADAGKWRSGARGRRASQYTMQVANRHATDGVPGYGARGKVVRIKELRKRSSLAPTLLKHRSRVTQSPPSGWQFFTSRA